MINVNVLNEAARLHALGFAVIWIRPKSKIPVEAGWTTGPRKDLQYLKATYREGMNVGVRLGTPSKIGKGYLAVIDVDVKNPKFKDKAVRYAKSLLPPGVVAPVVFSGRGNGSRHYYVLTLKPFRTITPRKSADWEVALYSDGRQVVLPPSIHPETGNEYRWGNPSAFDAPIPLVNFDAVLSEGGASSRAENSTQAPKLEDFRISPVELAWLPISKQVRTTIVEGFGKDEDRSGALLPVTAALISAGLSQNEVLSVLTDPAHRVSKVADDYARTSSRKRAAEWIHRFTFLKVERERSPVVFKDLAVPEPRKLSPEEAAKQADEFKEERQWRQDLDRVKDGRARVTLKNLDLILSNAVSPNVFIEDLFANRIEYGVDTPWNGKRKDFIQDIDMIRVKRWFSDTEFGIEPNTGQILEATSLVADRCRIHPVREWLEDLRWDGVKRIDTWVRDFCEGDAAEPYLSEVSRKFLLAMVKRIFEPGCQWDYVLVLEGKQGKYKSSIARALASDRWFMDNLPDLKDKDSMLNLQGKWLIELGELADVKRADYNLVKAYLVRRTDTVRPHYGRLKADVPRQSVFIGTINEGQYLEIPRVTDDTGRSRSGSAMSPVSRRYATSSSRRRCTSTGRRTRS